MRRSGWLIAVAVTASLSIAACGGSVERGGTGGGTGGAGTGGADAGGTGGSGGTHGTSPSGTIATTCQKWDALPCPLPTCSEELTEAYEQAQASGCDAQLLAVLECGNAQGWVCESSSPESEPYPPPACENALDALGDCGGGGEECMSGGSPSGECSMSCTGASPWGVSCLPAGGALQCTCTEGPNTGLAFSLASVCNSADWSSQVEASCR